MGGKICNFELIRLFFGGFIGLTAVLGIFSFFNMCMLEDLWLVIRHFFVDKHTCQIGLFTNDVMGFLI
jgi:hypothetical protein